MRILIANERLLFRFGLDRVLLVLARILRERGHEVTVMANRLDAAVAATVADRVIELPPDAETYLALNEHTASVLESRWKDLFPEGLEPDVALIGGWPFFAAIPVFRARGVRTAFLDCGAVPTDGMDEGGRITQEKLRALRRENLPLADAILAISGFIERTQSRVDAPHVRDIRALLLGADHLADSEWTCEQLRAGAGGTALATAQRLREQGAHLLLNLGRWEPGAYKNSEAVFGVARDLARRGKRIAVLVLDTPERVQVPADLEGVVVPIGFPDDREMAQVIDISSAGLSASRWEGFNLPVAEMQWAGKPAFALDVGAHPEVVCHPSFLVSSQSELAPRIAGFIDNGVPRGWPVALERFRRDFAWRMAGTRYVEALEEIAARPLRRAILVDATNACLDPANSGVMRVMRRATQAFRHQADVLFAVWSVDLQTYVWPNEQEYAQLSAYNGPVITSDMPRSPASGRIPVNEMLRRHRRKSTWLFLGETIMEARARAVRDWARAFGMRIVAVFYDAIPVLRPELVADLEIRHNHASYMKGLAQCDAVIPISGFSAACLRRFWAENGCRWAPVKAALLPDEMGGCERRTTPRKATRHRVDILCVSTIEPRKGHLVLLEAMKHLDRIARRLDWTLTLVGNRYAGGDALANAVLGACTADHRIRWLGIVDDATLLRLYAAATLTVYASTIEGYGMPIVESLWHGVPCVCHNDGVMAELAADGGCLTTDMSDPAAIAQAIVRLGTDRALYDRVSSEAVARKSRNWDDYAREIMSTLEGVEKAPPRPANWEDRLYPGCLTAEWQMTDSERLALTGLLHRHQPRLAIEIGTYRGGSLSLISQYAKQVISIDIDPAIPERYGHFKNVRFLTGFSQEVLPPLLDELDGAGLAVDFVLIDGDHSAAGVKRDIEIVIGRRPKAPMFILLHDGFNPECRRGMLEANWPACPYVQWVDTDFIPGRVIENGAGSGEMWGGLAAAFLAPEPRSGPLQVRTSAGGMWRELKERHYGEV